MAPPNSSAIPPSTDLEENKRAQARNSQDASSDQQALIEKLKAEVEALKGREKEVKEREKKAEEREKEAKENEKKAEEREKEAKENEKKAEEREKEAKEREKKAEEALNASMDPSLWRSVNATGALACTCVYAFCDKRIALQKATGLVFSGRAGAQIGMNFFSIGLALPAPFRTVPASRKNED
eukprot:tig00021435_g21413.t1